MSPVRAGEIILGNQLMDIFAILSLSLAPGIFWLWFFYKKDKLKPEPKILVVRMFFLGMFSLVPSALAEYPLRGMSLLQVVIAAPLIEECFKFLIVRSTIYRNNVFSRPMDGIIYAVAVALGFASSENALYIVTSYLAPQIALGMSDPLFGLGFVWKLYLIRAFLTVPGHAIWSSMWGYALGLAKVIETGNRWRLIAKGLFLAVVLHSVFNYLVLNFIPGAVGMLILIPVMWKMVYNRMEKALAGSPRSELQDDTSHTVKSDDSHGRGVR
jgi:RsiW-degrading membrane proteinase PrsW (M82 family)